MKHSGDSLDKTNPSSHPSLSENPARRGFFISYGGKPLLSRIDPVAQGERLAAEVPITENTLYLCPSPLYGYGLSVLLDRLKSKSAVLCVEADDRLFEISRRAITNNKSLALLKASNPESISAFVRKTWGERSFRRLEEVRLNTGWQLFPELYGELANALRREIALEWANAITLIHLGRLYARNLIRNLPLLSMSENITSLEFTSPALVLGAGPSLDPTLEELSGLWGGKIPGREERSFRIICADTCLGALNERQISPDLVVVLESQHWNLKDFSGIRGLCIDSAFDLSALPASTRVLAGKRFFFATPWTELSLFKRLKEAELLPEIFAPLGSVGLNAVALALRASKGPVITCGIDFSYSMDAYHARSTPGNINLRLRQNRFKSIINASAAYREGTFPALSKLGKQVRSDPAMRNYRDLFEEEFGGNKRLMDISSHGLPLGVTTITPAEAFAILNSPSDPQGHEQKSTAPSRLFEAEKTSIFIRQEMHTLQTIKAILTGDIPPEQNDLEELLDTADYLWAHFPECAGAGGRRPPSTDLSFLKRVRAEIDPFQKLWEMSLGELAT